MLSLLLCSLVAVPMCLANTALYRITSEGEVLAELINDYREEEGLSRIPLSPAMMTVGQWHVDNTWYAIDVSRDWYDTSLYHCNLHTWWEEPPMASFYSQCCYTSDHAEAACMWDKPEEITNGWTYRYYGSGFEIAASGFMTEASALTGWKGSRGHNDVMINGGQWASYTFRSLGCGVDVSKRLYFCWFGFDADFNPYTGPNEGADIGTDTTTSTTTTSTTTTSTTTTTTTTAAPAPVCCNGRRNQFDKECAVHEYENGEPGPNQSMDLCNNYQNESGDYCCRWKKSCS